MALKVRCLACKAERWPIQKEAADKVEGKWASIRGWGTVPCDCGLVHCRADGQLVVVYSRTHTTHGPRPFEIFDPKNEKKSGD